MVNIREFIRNLGDKAPAFFDTKEQTVTRWLKTGSIPMKAVEKVLMAAEAMRVTGTAEFQTNTPPPPNTPEPIRVIEKEPEIDPMTNMPVGAKSRMPEFQGGMPAEIEIDPSEQNWGNNLTRPGRLPQSRPLPPMKIRKVNGQDIPFVDTQPAPPTVIPPEIGGGADWSKPREQSVEKEPTEGVSETKV